MKEYKKIYAPEIKLCEQYYRSGRINENTDGVYDTYEQFVGSYDSCDKDEYWFKLSVIIEDDYSFLWIDDSNIIAINPSHQSGFPYDFDELLTFLNHELNNIIDKVVKGTYNEYLNKNLP